MIRRLALIAIIVILAASPAGAQSCAPDSTAPIWEYEVIAEYSHDPDTYTQGLVVVDGVLYEGTGLARLNPGPLAAEGRSDHMA